MVSPTPERVLFLDIDGVLNSSRFFGTRGDLWTPPDGEDFRAGMIDPAAVVLLDQIVERTACEIVISSSWRIPYTMGEIGRALGAKGFKARRSIIDKTPSLGGVARGDEIDAWLKSCGKGEVTFAILDDAGDMEMHAGRLVQTSYQEGLKQEHVERIVSLLGEALNG